LRRGKSAIFEGVPNLVGSPVCSTDLRAGAALILAGIVAKGKTEISNLYHIDRGYEQIENKFKLLGAKIERINE
jgi:UDP-N-acetylglucosamine 1-carboxyvinyltransferase